LFLKEIKIRQWLVIGLVMILIEMRFFLEHVTFS
jgi:hypothetical protein